jgi:hypothetical protein
MIVSDPFEDCASGGLAVRGVLHHPRTSREDAIMLTPGQAETGADIVGSRIAGQGKQASA